MYFKVIVVCEITAKANSTKNSTYSLLMPSMAIYLPVLAIPSRRPTTLFSTLVSFLKLMIFYLLRHFGNISRSMRYSLFGCDVEVLRLKKNI
jgi:hypothetical protein